MRNYSVSGSRSTDEERQKVEQDRVFTKKHMITLLVFTGILAFCAFATLIIDILEITGVINAENQ
jgi:hypothetical protein